MTKEEFLSNVVDASLLDTAADSMKKIEEANESPVAPALARTIGEVAIECRTYGLAAEAIAAHWSEDMEHSDAIANLAFTMEMAKTTLMHCIRDQI